MKPVSIHPFSALAGAGLLGVVLLAVGAVQAPIQVQPFPKCVRRLVRIAGIPDPRQMVVIKEGAPYTVPSGKLLAITALGGTHDTLQVTLRVDGQNEIAASARLPYGNSTTIAELPPGFTVRAGSTVDVVSAGGLNGCAWGHLVDAVPSTPGLVRVAGIPDPRSMLVIREKMPFVVPTGKVLAITGVGGVTDGVQAVLRVARRIRGHRQLGLWQPILDP